MPSSLTCTFLLLWLSQICMLLALLGLERNVGALPQKLACRTGAVGLAAITSRGLARQRWPAFLEGVNGRTLQ